MPLSQGGGGWLEVSNLFIVFCGISSFLASSFSKSHNEKMRNRRLIVTTVTVFLLTFSSLYVATGATLTNTDAKKRLAYCGSIPNGASLTVVSTTRFFLFLPKDIYPRLKLVVTSHGATAGSISNAGPDGYAQSKSAKSDCWSHYFEFDLSPNNKTQGGKVDISSKSTFKTISNYIIHVTVVSNPPSATKQLPGNGTVVGQVVLGPVCPVEHIPPDPACAPRSYKTSIDIWSIMTGSSYQRVSTDALGSFKLSLIPGNYSVAVTQPTNGSPYPRCTPVNFSVTAKKVQKITINCDTGIR